MHWKENFQCLKQQERSSKKFWSQSAAVDRMRSPVHMSKKWIRPYENALVIVTANADWMHDAVSKQCSKAGAHERTHHVTDSSER